LKESSALLRYVVRDDFSPESKEKSGSSKPIFSSLCKLVLCSLDQRVIDTDFSVQFYLLAYLPNIRGAGAVVGYSSPLQQHEEILYDLFSMGHFNKRKAVKTLAEKQEH